MLRELQTGGEENGEENGGNVQSVRTTEISSTVS